jgi:hypothetical protein
MENFHTHYQWIFPLLSLCVTPLLFPCQIHAHLDSVAIANHRVQNIQYSYKLFVSFIQLGRIQQ